MSFLYLFSPFLTRCCHLRVSKNYSNIFLTFLYQPFFTLLSFNFIKRSKYRIIVRKAINLWLSLSRFHRIVSFDEKKKIEITEKGKASEDKTSNRLIRIIETCNRVPTNTTVSDLLSACAYAFRVTKQPLRVWVHSE